MTFDCSTCTYHIALHKHPWNKGELKGSISEETGLYACILDYFMSKKNIGIIEDRIGNGCEMHTPKKINNEEV